MNTEVDRSRLGVGTVTINETAKRYVHDVLESGRLSYGPYIQQFERRFSQMHGASFGVMVNSGTSALQIAIACLAEVHGWKEGDEIIVPALTFVATANVVIQQGLKPVFVDVDAGTYNIDPFKIESAITPRTVAIIPVHLFGQPSEMDEVMHIARKHDLRVIEDSCETMFVSHRDQSIGSIGDIGCFSTYAAHLVVTGVGGIAITNNPKYAEILRSIANHGRDGIYIGIDDAKGIKGEQFKQVIDRRFRFERMGYSYRVTEFEGALGCAQLDMAEEMIRVRNRNAEMLSQKLEHLSSFLQLPFKHDHNGHAFMMYPIVIREGLGVQKSDLVHYLEEQGIETRDMLPLTNQPIYQRLFGTSEDDYPIAKWINNYGFYVGCHQDMREQELDYLAGAMTSFFAQHKQQSTSAMKTALITGVNGQDGSYLAELLLEKGYRVVGIVRRASTFNRWRLNDIYKNAYHRNNQFHLEYADLNDASSIMRVIQEYQPDEIYNLGAQSHVQVSFETPEYTANISGVGVLRVLEAVRMLGMEKKVRFYQASTSELFGKVAEVPQNEETPFHPRSPYGVAKMYGYWIVKNYREAYGMYAVNGILFNHESPRRGENFVSKKITRALAGIKLGKDEVLRLGNLDAKRDWGYAKEYMESVWLMLQQEVPEDYVIATGQTRTVREFVEETCRYLDIDLIWVGQGRGERGIDRRTNKVIIELDSRYLRPAEVDILQGDGRKAREKMGWEPKVPFSELVRLMVDHDLAEIRHEMSRDS